MAVEAVAVEAVGVPQTLVCGTPFLCGTLPCVCGTPFSNKGENKSASLSQIEAEPGVCILEPN